MRTNIEWDILSIYPYREENIQELICRLYTMVEELKANGQVIDPKLIEKINNIIEQLKNKQISIDMFGAVGDGVKDDTTAIQSALEFCWANNIYELYIPKGRYKVTRGIETREVKLTGLSKPYAPNPIGFDYAFPTLPAQGKPAVREHWISQCGGSIIDCSEDIQIFIDGLIAENIMIFGDVNQKQQCGIGQNNGGKGKQIMLEGVTILCCGGHGIFAPFGLISPKIRNCRINSCMGNAIHIGNMKGNYTGETNNVVIEHNDLNRNGAESIKMNVNGRVFNIQYNEMEHVGFVSHMIDNKLKTPPTRDDDIIYCCDIVLSGGGSGFGTGEVVFTNNYSESGYGLLKLKPASGVPFDVINNVSILNNLWLPHTEEGHSCGINLDGNVWRVTIWDNKIFNYSSPNHYTVKVGHNVQNITTNSPITNAEETNKNVTFKSEIGGANPVNDLYSLGEYQIGKKTTTELSNPNYHASGDGRTDFTRFNYSAGTLTNVNLGFNFEKDGVENIVVGDLVKFKGNTIGIVMNVSTAHRIIDVKGNKVDIINQIKTGVGDISFHHIGGIYLLDGNHKQVKIVADGEKVYSIPKQ